MNDIGNEIRKRSEKISSCMWMIDTPMPYAHSFRECRKTCLWWYEKFIECLPDKELFALQQNVKKLSMSWRYNIFASIMNYIPDELRKFEMILTSVRYNMVEILLNEKKRKEEMLFNAAAMSKISRQPTEKTSMETYRLYQLTERLPHGSGLWRIQRDNFIEGYVPTIKILNRLEPIEILEYMNVSLRKYDKLHGYFSALIQNSKTNTQEILYNQDAMILEQMAEEAFEKALSSHIASVDINPFYNKTFGIHQDDDI